MEKSLVILVRFTLNCYN